MFRIIYTYYTYDDVHNKIFLNVLNLSKCRNVSLKGKSSILNTFAYSKIIYHVMARVPPDYYLNMFQRRCFSFMWRTRYEQIARKTLYLPLSNGGLMVPNIKLKCNSIYLLHVSKLINNYNAPWTHFAKYWIGLSLQNYNESFASNLLPHSEYVPLSIPIVYMYLEVSLKITHMFLSLHGVLKIFIGVY